MQQPTRADVGVDFSRAMTASTPLCLGFPPHPHFSRIPAGSFHLDNKLNKSGKRSQQVYRFPIRTRPNLGSRGWLDLEFGCGFELLVEEQWETTRNTTNPPIRGKLTQWLKYPVLTRRIEARGPQEARKRPARGPQEARKKPKAGKQKRSCSLALLAGTFPLCLVGSTLVNPTKAPNAFYTFRVAGGCNLRKPISIQTRIIMRFTK